MRMRGHAEHDDMKYVPHAHARGVGRARTRSCATSGGSSIRASPRPSELDGVVGRASKPCSPEDLAWAEASPLPDPTSGLAGVYADRDVAPPTPAPRRGVGAAEVAR